MKVLFYSIRKFEKPFITKANTNFLHQLAFTTSSLTINTVEEAQGFDAIAIFSADTANAEVLQKLAALGIKYITLRSTGYDNVDLNSAKQLGIKVANVPSYSPYAIAEHAVGLLLALNRKLIVANQRIQQFNFNLDGLTGFDLKSKTIGILGTGNIGAVMAKIMHGFGCTLLGFDIEHNEHLTKHYGLSYVSLDELCKKADIISIHLPLNETTHHLIDTQLLKLMKPGVYIINTGRGAIIDTTAIIEALENNKIAGLGIDVYEFEKGVFFKDLSNAIPDDALLKKLIDLPNVILTGHQAFLTNEALTNIADTTIENLNAFQAKKQLSNELTSNITQLF